MFEWLTKTRRIRALRADIERLQATLETVREQQDVASARASELADKMTMLDERGTANDERLSQRLEAVQTGLEQGQENLSSTIRHIDEANACLSKLHTSAARLDRRLQMHEEETAKVHDALVERIEAARAHR